LGFVLPWRKNRHKLLSIHPNTLFTGKHFTYLKEIDSTNEEIKRRLAQKKLPEGYLLATAFQKAGKGQLNRSWESNAGENILASVYFSRKSISSKEQNALSFAVALAIFQTVEHFAEPETPVHIKWPNDILLDEKKISGILIENIVSGNQVHHIIGVGINVNQTHFLDNNKSTSLRLNRRERLPLEKILENMCLFLEQSYLTLSHLGGLQQIHKKYVERLYKRGGIVQIGSPLDACRVLGVDPLGRLIVDMAGKQVALTHNEKKILWS
jgi:BirA family biotin operon repressor/biotin-[acetyl-CoA-carboxylase] ligase